MNHSLKHSVKHTVKYTVKTFFAMSALVYGASACSFADLIDVERPNTGIVDEDYILTYEGALAARNGTITLMASTFVGSGLNSVAQVSGLFTDELRMDNSGSRIDARVRERDGTGPLANDAYNNLQRARVGAAQARWALKRHTTARPVHIAELYALEAYAEVMLAELFCSGIPLTSVEYGKQLTYTRGYSTDEVLRHAIALFDSAATLTTDSVPVLTLVRVGKGRALLNLGQQQAAAQAVADVPDGATYQFRYSGTGTDSTRNNFYQLTYLVVNQKGQNGLAWIAPNGSTQDPRIPLITPGPRQNLYTSSGDVPATLASGVEARLIEAESQLRPAENPSGTWLATLNTLRARLEGAGGVRLLADTTDPGTPAERVDLLFRERAFWLYLTGHRQGDLRRLIRQYGRSVNDVFPAGPYAPAATGNQWSAYGSDVTFEPNVEERLRNPLYRGCIDRNA